MGGFEFDLDSNVPPMRWNGDGRSRRFRGQWRFGGIRPTVSGTIARVVLAGGLAAVLLLLMLSTALPWETGLSGWGLLNAPYSETVSGWQVGAVPLAPFALGFGLLVLWRRTLVPRILLFLVAAGGLLCIGADTLFPLDGQQWPGIGLGFAVLGWPILFLGSVVLLVLRRQQRGSARALFGSVRGPVSLLALAGVIVLGAITALGGLWYTSGWVDASTADGSVPALTGAPGHVMWKFTGRLHPNGIESIDDGTVAAALPGGLVAIEHGSDGDIVVYDAATGAQRWHYTRHGAVLTNLAVSSDGHTLVAFYQARQRGTTLGLDANTGAVLWTRSSDWLPYGQVTALPDMVVGVDGDDVATAFDPTTGNTLWTDSGPANCPNAQSVAGGEGGLTILAINCDDGSPVELQAIDHSGHTLWNVDDPADIPGTGAPAQPTVLAADASVIVVDTDGQGRIIGLDPANGHVRWTLTSKQEHVIGLAGPTLLTAIDGKPDETDAHLMLRNALTGAPAAHQPGTPIRLAGDDPTTATIVGDTAYLMAGNDAGGAVLTVLDPATARVTASYPLPLESVAGIPRAAFLPSSIAPGSGFIVLSGAALDSTDIDPFTGIVVRLP